MINNFNNYVIDPISSVYLPNNFDVTSFVYSDGDESEKYLRDTILSTKDISSTSYELNQKAKDWVSSYHLSSRRSNLLRPMRHRLQGRVLEIGGGCGAITRYLGEVAREVVSVEGGFSRAVIAKLRCRDLGNVKIVCDNISNFRDDEKYDVVTLIGVLEYARIYFQNHGPKRDPIISLLQHAKSFLKDDGILLLAIENKLGLKYFAGYPEDHLGVPMAGIEGLYTENSVVTFGKKELTDKLKSAGFSYNYFYYPFPDYKLPTSVLCDDLIEYHDKINLSYIPQTSELYDLQKPEYTTFNMNLVWEEVYKNNLWNELSNSFLVLSGNYKNVESNIAYHYSINRIEKFQKEIIFTKNFKVNKNFINKIEVDPNEYAPFTLTLSEEEFANGENWESKLHRILNTPGWTFQTLSDWLRVWMDCFKKQISYPGDQIPLDYMIEGKYLDAIPRNLILTENGFQFIDLEWNYKGSISFKHILFRAIFNSFFSNHTISKTAMEKVSEYKNWNLIKKVLIDSNYWLHNDDFLNFVDQEMEFQTVISNHFDLVKINQDWLDISSSFRQDYRNYHQKDRVIQLKDMTLEEKDRVIQSKDMVLEEKDRVIQSKDITLEEKDRVIQSKDITLEEKDRVIQSKDITLEEKDRVIQSKDITLEEKDRVIQSKDITLEEKDRVIQKLEINLINYKSEIINLNTYLNSLLLTTSWRLTKPLRYIKKYFIK